MRIYDVFLFSLKEAIRARFFLAVFIFSLLSMIAGAILGGVPWGDVDQVILNLGWGAISLMSLLVGVLYTAQVVHRDRDKRILYMILARPVSRFSYVLGKYLAIITLLALASVLMAIVLYVSVSLWGIRSHNVYEFAIPTFWIWAKSASLVGYALAFALLFSYLPALFYTFSVYVAGSTLGDAIAFVESGNSQELAPILELVYYLMPNYNILDLVNRVVHEIAIPDTFTILLAGLYWLGYGGIMLAVAGIVFERRDLD